MAKQTEPPRDSKCILTGAGPSPVCFLFGEHGMRLIGGCMPSPSSLQRSPLDDSGQSQGLPTLRMKQQLPVTLPLERGACSAWRVPRSPSRETKASSHQSLLPVWACLGQMRMRTLAVLRSETALWWLQRPPRPPRQQLEPRTTFLSTVAVLCLSNATDESSPACAEASADALESARALG